MNSGSELLVVGARVDGLVNGRPVEILSVSWVGDAALVQFVDDDGLRADRLVFPQDMETLRLVNPAGAHTLDADRDVFGLAFRALRLRYTHLIDPLMAVSAANVEPLPHQVQAVYDHLLRRYPLRYLLADDPGAGKTIMAGLYIREAMARGWVRRCLIAAPGGLVEQWQDELQLKFGLGFEIFDRSLIAGRPAPEAFAELPRLIVRIDQVARDARLRGLVARVGYDLAVVDEAHKMTASYFGGRLRKSKRYELGELLRDSCRSVLLMTATPHNGKEEDFQLFLRLLDQDRFVGRAAHHEGGIQLTDVMRRLVKEQLCHADGRPLFPERRASTVAYQLSDLERALYDQVSDYVRHEMDKVEGDESRRTVGFALLVLQRRLASSPEAILRSLERRRDRLREEARMALEREALLASRRPTTVTAATALEDEEELLRAEIEQLEDEVVAGATASRTVADLEVEVRVLEGLVAQARTVRDAGVDRKWEALAQLLRSPEMYDGAGERRKIIVFTEHRDTLDYVERRIRIDDILGATVGMEIIHGGTSRGDRRLAQSRFSYDPNCTILLATDAAGEGVNLQQAHLMVNYDLPWNPNRLEQRFGRIHRIGQTEVCHLWNLVASDTREGAVFTTLLEKVEAQRQALGDQVFDVLGEVLSGRDLRDLLASALRGETRDQIRAVVEQRVGADLERAVASRTEAVSQLTAEDLASLRALMTLSAARRVQPELTDHFVRDAMARLRGDVRTGGDGRCRVVHVPERVRGWSGSVAGAVRRRYEALAFDRRAIEVVGRAPAELLAPGHPFLDALVGVVLEDHGSTLVSGTVLQDDAATAPYVLACFLHRVTAPANDAVFSERIVAVGVADTVEELDPARAFGLQVSMHRAEVTNIEEAVQRATRYVADIFGQAHARDTAERRSTLLSAASAAMERRLAAESQRLAERLSRVTDREGESAPDAEPLRKAIAGLERRLETRRAEAAAGSEVAIGEPVLLAVAAVVGTPETRTQS